MTGVECDVVLFLAASEMLSAGGNFFVKEGNELLRNNGEPEE